MRRNRQSNHAEAAATRRSQTSARLSPAPHSGSVDGSNRDERGTADPVEPAVDAADAGWVTLSGGAQVGEVVTGAESASGAGDLDGVDVIAAFEVVERGVELGDQVGGEDVAASGVVQRYPGDPLPDRDP